MPQNNGEVRKTQRKAGADAQAERWRIHREHCTANDHDAVCWGPDACQECVRIGNAPRPT